jgi:hypothetical protein
MGLSKKLKGEHITADEWNALVDAVHMLQLPTQVKRTSFPEVKFTCSSTVPAYGVVGVSSQSVREGLPYIVAVPHTDGPILVNVGSEASKGLCYPIFYPTLVKAATGASITVGQPCGPKSGTFEVDQTGSGLIALSSVLDGLLWVVGASGGAGQEECCELCLPPGSYMANAVGTITPGASGLVYYYGKTLFAFNHSQCAVGPGFPVGLHITPQCTAFFVPCTCCGNTPIDPPPPEEGCEACDGPFIVCVNGSLVTLNYGELKYVFFSDCELCPPSSSGVDAVTVAIGLRCVEGQPELYGWVTCNSCNTVPNMSPFTLDISSLCAAPSSVIEDALTIACGVFTDTIPIKVSKSTAPDCPSACDGEVTPTDPPSSPCCEQSLYFCLNQVSQLLAVNGGTFTWDVSA